MLTQQYLKECFTYNPNTGSLIWKTRPLSHFSSSQERKRWNTRYAGIEAGNKKTCRSKKEYIFIKLEKTLHAAHRIVFFIVNGDWPSMQIDHINGCGTDNRIANIRNVTAGDNSRNRRIQHTNKSGASDVAFRKDTGKWRARISFNGVRINLGQFARLEDAISARNKAENEHGYHPNHGSVRPL
jgi:hypothetical protein